MWMLNLFKNKEEVYTEQEKQEEHKHAWVLVSKTYARPRREILLDKLEPALIEKAMFGFTTLGWECSTCGHTRQEIMIGSDVNTLDEVIDKTLEFGSQVVEREGNRYILTKWNPQQTAAGIVPIR